MTETVQKVLTFLEASDIPFTCVEHEPVRTIGDCAVVDERLGAVTAKNYFLTTKNKKKIVLCIVRPEAKFHTADISRQLESSRLSFGTEEQMRTALCVYPGAVSPLGLIFDTDGIVELAVDKELIGMERLAFHPCDNSMTVALSSHDFFEHFLPAVRHTYRTVEIHDFLDGEA